jgi:hypothetical protein
VDVPLLPGSHPHRIVPISYQPPTILPSQDSRNDSWSSLYSLGVDSTENTASTVLAFIKYATIIYHKAYHVVNRNWKTKKTARFWLQILKLCWKFLVSSTLQFILPHHLYKCSGHLFPYTLFQFFSNIFIIFAKI